MNEQPILKIIVWIIISSGGVGKTLLAQTCEAIAHLLGADILLASQDRGNQALKHALGKSVVQIDPSSLAQDARRIVSRVQSREIFVIDVGANAATKEHDPLPFAAALNDEATKRGARMIAVVPAAPLKIHCAETANDTALDLMNEGIDVHVVKNHLNQSGNFGKMDLVDGVEMSELPFLESGLLELLRIREGSFADAYLDPEPGFELAGNHIGAWLENASKMPLMRDIFGPEVSEIRIPDRRRPKPISRVLNQLSDVTDPVLEANYEMAAAHLGLFDSQLDDAAQLAALARYRVAHSTWAKSRRQHKVANK